MSRANVGRTRPIAACATLALSFCLSLSSPIANAAEKKANSDESCLDCHNDKTLTMEKDHRDVSLFVEAGTLQKSIHRSLSCIDCHEGFDGDASPHKKPMTRVDCASCHENLGKSHPFHLRLGADPLPAGKDTDCVACHGAHTTQEVADPGFAFKRPTQAAACGECHERARDRFLVSAHGRAYGKGDSTGPTCMSCHEKPVTRNGEEPRSLKQKMAETQLCESCHVKDEHVAGKALRGKHFTQSFENSVHGAALAKGEAKAANCVDCHGAHEMERAFVSGTRMNKALQSVTCGRCHDKFATQFDGSVHALALRKGNFDSPACTDCHGEHEIRAHKDPQSPVHERNVAQQVCATCHASLKLSKKYGLASHAFQTFADSYHGLAVRGGSVEVVNCASCHNSHEIKSHKDPTSSVHKDNLVQTCGQCHPGANTRFTVGSVHVSAETPEKDGGSDPILHIVATVYLILIGAVTGGMFVHNALDLLKKIRRKLAIQRGDIVEEHVEHRLYVRMTGHERLQHATLVISFMLLVVTGFMLRFPEAWWVSGIRNLSARAFEWRSLIHRIAGIVMLAGGAWHVGYLAFTAKGRALFRDLLPRKRDLTDPWKVLRYNVGLAPTKPEFPRFSYIEKAEYWALVWGTLLMGATGAVLWFENTSMGLMTKLGYDVSRTIHFYEAILATLAIIVWHFYFVIFNPDIYPMNLAWLTGKMSEKEMLDEHPLELKRLKEEEERKLGKSSPEDPEI